MDERGQKVQTSKSWGCHVQHGNLIKSGVGGKRIEAGRPVRK